MIGTSCIVMQLDRKYGKAALRHGIHCLAALHHTLRKVSSLDNARV